MDRESYHQLIAKGRLAPHASMTLQAAAMRGASELLNAYSIPFQLRMSPRADRLFLCDRLSIPPPFLAGTTSCVSTCSTHSPHRIQRDPESTQQTKILECRHGYHQFSCKGGGLVITRHNVWAKRLALFIKQCYDAYVTTTCSLRTNEESFHKIDIAVDYINQPTRWATALDPTITCPQSSSYVRQTADTVVRWRSKEKDDKHDAACARQHREFIPVVVLAAGGGIGSTLDGSASTDRFWKYWDEMAAHTRAINQSSGISDFETAVRRNLVLAELQVINIRHSTFMLAKTIPTTPSPPQQHAPQTQPHHQTGTLTDQGHASPAS